MKYLLHFLSNARKLFGIRIFIFGIATGLANTALISIINETIKYGIDEKMPSPLLAAGYVLSLLLYFLLQYSYQALLIRSAESLILQSRKELIDRIRKSSLQSFEKLGSTRLFVLISADTATIGQIATLASGVITSVIVITGVLLYLLVISIKGFLLTITIIAISFLVALAKQKQNIRRIKHLMELQNTFLGYVQQMLNGMKEIKIDSQVDKGLYDTQIKPRMEEVSSATISNNVFQSRFSLLGQSIFFITMGCILYLFPLLKVTITENNAQFVIMLIYILGPLQSLLPLIPQFSRIKSTLERLEEAMKTLQEEASAAYDSQQAENSFTEIRIRDLTYTYKTLHNDEFSLGPINLDIKAGDLIFIHGGNGSGKSTLIKVLTGLYPQSGGSIMRDNQLIDYHNLQMYRNMFGVIFTDNHLFEHIHGVDQTAAANVQQLIRKVGLVEKVNFSQNQFDTIDLSEGQKKRVALVSALVRNKPIYIFDEWAANQDPDFKHFFYQNIIPELSKQRKTVILITHDDRYLHIAQRVIKMENGKIQEQKV
ncbi:cyclic peptide export ABC transporter [Chitinophaga oryzae]|uniref:Cyclic peptide export ABC transporter n=1 Tax=Chitinophaga oryzae TaxID=2725414 RepID=A0AAE6ZHM0_9BACT|nr:cyclic peptide export ABC transporter [Chitinophaga oryzae]QJB31624.1 cyclic peptide export ABC transporter [Chitinophaga oryzae]QJB38108.1 cyclic peptide export ABC transporter [Chitinophaga oryzae]